MNLLIRTIVASVLEKIKQWIFKYEVKQFEKQMEEDELADEALQDFENQYFEYLRNRKPNPQRRLKVVKKDDSNSGDKQ